ncbi:glycosyltransferase family 9 protein [Paramagnetospirillum marisnigri]|uniref:glycosyltransferase family 9 protein n=1 Tax=Paramagnetospirillum marisnigri TaxID=1285242 RepID=UPI001FE1D13F|nr:glycosyltransferase family 9 protein [Paramagnetospirillum marisnigri]
MGLDAVGDGLIKLPFLRSLRAAFPQARITWMAGKGHTVFAGILAPLVAGLVDEVLDDAGIGSRVSELFANPLPSRRFDLIIDTQRRLLTTLILRRIRHGRFISAAAGFRLSAARPADHRRPASLAKQMTVLLDLAAPHRPRDMAPLPHDAGVEAEADRLLPAGPCYVGLAPGAGGKHKCWPLERFCELGNTLARRGMTPVVLLGPAEADWIEPVRRLLPGALLPLQEAAAPSPMLTIALARRMACALANDSGTGHMLACGDIPLVSLFGPTPPEKFAPNAQRLTVVRAQDYGGSDMATIPVAAVERAITECLL